ncbi:MAG: PorV/PorQ family protein [Candidatus Marinimicrobia bacterium]|nr:PorV/PorQ family protein [Candidatus Neomarinimicrobiota bacterium]
MRSLIKVFGIVATTSIMLLADGSLGQSGANFLQIGATPRGAALGGGMTALATGAEALYWNPAGAIFASKTDIYLSHTDWFLDTKLTFGGAVMKYGPNNAFGISATVFSMEDQEITTVFEPDGTGEYYGSGDIAVGLSYARKMTDRFSFGISGKYIQETLYNESASQMALDAGSVYQTGFHNLRIGTAVRNFSGNLEFGGKDIDDRIAEEEAREEEDNPRIERLSSQFRLPQVFQMGVAVDAFEKADHCVTMIVDVDVPSDNEERVVMGCQYRFRKMAWLGASYQLNYDTAGLNAGGGIIVKGLRLDYSYSNHDVFSSIHRFGIGYSF